MSDIEKRGWVKLGQIYDRVSETHTYVRSDPIFAGRLVAVQQEIENFAHQHNRIVIFGKGGRAKLVVRPLTRS